MACSLRLAILVGLTAAMASPSASAQNEGEERPRGDADDRSVELRLFGYETSQTKSTYAGQGGRFTNKSDHDSFGVTDGEDLRLALYGRRGFLLVDLSPGFVYGLSVGVRESGRYELGIEFDLGNEHSRDSLYQNGGREVDVLDSRVFALGVVYARERALDQANAKAIARLGVTTVKEEDEDRVTWDSTGWYLGLEGEYARPLRAFGADLEQVYGVAYRYDSLQQDVAPGFYPLTGHVRRTSHVWEFKLFALRLHF